MRAIDADELIEFINDKISDGSEDPASQYTIIRDETLMEIGGKVKSMETVDAEPVKHAHWIPCENETGEGSNTYKCSACGEIQMIIDGTPKDNGWKYCPHCGAKMGEENYDGRD